MRFLELAPDFERLHLYFVKVEKTRLVRDLRSNKMPQSFVAMECSVDLQMLREMLCGHELVEFRYKPFIADMWNVKKRNLPKSASSTI